MNLRVLSVVLLAGVLASGQSISFDEAAARHLLSRAGFGGSVEQVQRCAALGIEKAVDELLKQAALPPKAPFTAQAHRLERSAVAGMTREEREAERRKIQQADLGQLRDFTAWWMSQMCSQDAPLREKLTLFWHGYFTSSMRDVRDSQRMIRQNELFRREGCGSFRELLLQITLDPAMMEYLDNDENRARKPNENYAREVMELFTLGVGNYTEKDISEAARALAGWQVRGDEVSFDRRNADRGVKTVLGQTGRFDTREFIELLLAQEAAPRHVAMRLMKFFVGDEFSPEYHARIAAALRASDWKIAPVLRALFTDPEFWSDAVRGARILGPVEFVVGISVRLGETPPPALMAASASLMGQTLFDPPDVKGWDGGEQWINSASLLHRNNWAGYLVEGVSPRKLMADFGGARDGTKPDRRLAQALRTPWKPALRLRTTLENQQIASAESLVKVLCRRFLCVEPTTEAVNQLSAFVTQAGWFHGGTALPPEEFLRSLLHMILSLPEAQLG